MKTVLITGANRGIGFESARQLAVRGFHVIVAARSEQCGKKAVSELERSGKISLLVVDVSDSKSIALAASMFAATEKLDVLINNAGICPDEGTSILTIPREQMVSTFHTNTFGPLEMTQAFLPYLKKSPAARVINVSSGYGESWRALTRCPELLPFKTGVEWTDDHARRSLTGAWDCGELDMPRMGSDRHGRIFRTSFC